MLNIKFTIMKKILLGIMCIILCVACSKSSKNYTVEGTIANMDDGKIFIIERVKGANNKIAEADIVNGKFTFSGSVDTPKLVYLADNDTTPFYSFFIDNMKIKINGDKNVVEDFTIEGGEDNTLFTNYKNALKQYNDQEKELSDKFDKAKGDTAMEALLDKQGEQLDNSKKMLVKEFVVKNTGSIVSTYLLYANSYYFDLDEIDSLFTQLNGKAISIDNYNLLKEYIDKMKTVSVGAKFVDFTMNDTAGNPVALSSLVGKGYLLVDFWASWCQYCRVENPNVVAAYVKYHDKGFDVLGVSLDKDKSAWINAITADKLTWMQVSDLASWDNAAAQLYAVRSIPSNVLISPEGVIVAKNITGVELNAKLKEIYK